MNYLAHLFLSGEDPEVILGNFIADGITSRMAETFPAGIRKGIEMHRFIDHHTDRHEGFKEVVQILRPRHGKYAPVVADILNDYLLCQNWNLYSQEEFEQFEKRIYKSLHIHFDLLKGKHRGRVRSLLLYRYLRAYRTRTGLRGVMKRMDKRARFASAFVESLTDLDDHYAIFNARFKAVFDNLITGLESFD